MKKRNRNPQNNKKNNVAGKRKNLMKLSLRRMVVLLCLFLLLFILLIGRIGYIQFAQGAWLKQKEYSQSTTNMMISAKRGTIYDVNGKALALSAAVDTISVNPAYINVKNDGVTDEKATQELKEKMAQAFADIFEINYDEVLTKLTSDKSVETIVSKVESDKVEILKKWLEDNDAMAGINIDEDTKRYYPYGNLASNLIGFCGTNNQGLDGVELEYDNVLKGTNGKLTTAISVTQDAIPDENEQYIEPENGSNIYLTIDSNIQSIVEKYLKQAIEENKAKRGGNVIIMNPQNGEILAMATYPDYNLNDPYKPNETIKAGWDNLSGQEQTNRLYSMWRNRAVLDTYEPGSTFKVITASIALEENLIETDHPGDFYCSGVEVVGGNKINCTSKTGHGSQSLRQAIENSCNPALIQLGRKIQKETFYKYLKAYGFFEKTGIDLPSEGESSFWNESDVGPVELATMSFGQRFTITPMQLVKAVSAIANDGVLVTPHVVRAIEKPDTGTIKTIEKNEERQVLSKEVSQKLKGIMQSVVEEGGGSHAKVIGYTVGGKTGTSEPDPNHLDAGYVSSFIAIAPVENTNLVTLLTLYGTGLSGANYYGGTIAAPVVSQMLSEILPYLNILPNEETSSQQSNLISVPNVENRTLAEAEKIIKDAGLTYSFVGNSDEVVSEQVPKVGTRLMNGGVVKLYTVGNDQRVSQTVPDVKGVSLAQAKNMLKAKNLNISSKGSGIVISQDPPYGTSVDEGTIINVTLQEAISQEQH